MLRSLSNQRLGRYDLKELLGRGGMAAVYRAVDSVLLRDVALKILYPQFGDDAALVQRFQREAVTAASLEHPNIVPVYDVGEQDGMAYIAMKLLAGQTMQAWLQAVGAVDLDTLLSVLVPVAAALDYAHARGVVHRDIKPGNIFLSETSDGRRVLLTDFGIAKQLDAPGLTTTGAMIGTPDYMAPEQIAGRPVDARTDVYALGMLAYRALTGRRAFEGSTQDVLLGHLYDRPTPPSQLNPTLPEAVDAVVDRASATAPEDRFASAGAFVAALRQVARSAPAGTAVGPPPALAPRPAPAAPPPTRRVPTPPPVAIRQPTAPVSAAPATGAPASRSTLPGPAASARGSAPWLVAIVLALIAGGLAVALALALGRQVEAGIPPLLPSTPPPPPSATLAPSPAPPSATSEPTAVATATSEPSATAEQPTLSPSAPPAVTAPTRPVPPTVAAPPSATPTLTALPSATATPSPSPTETVAPSATPTATPVVAQCDNALLQGGFGKLFDENIEVRTRLGCPRAGEVAGDGSEQFFEQGMMFYWADQNAPPKNDYIYVFYGRDAGMFEELSPDQVSEYGPDPTPGPDPNQPMRGFGRVYFFKPGVRELLGDSRSIELELKGDEQGVMQRFEQGLMIYTPSYQPTAGAAIFVLYDDGAFQRFDDAFGAAARRENV